MKKKKDDSIKLQNVFRVGCLNSYYAHRFLKDFESWQKAGMKRCWSKMSSSSCRRRRRYCIMTLPSRIVTCGRRDDDHDGVIKALGSHHHQCASGCAFHFVFFYRFFLFLGVERGGGGAVLLEGRRKGIDFHHFWQYEAIKKYSGTTLAQTDTQQTATALTPLPLVPLFFFFFYSTKAHLLLSSPLLLASYVLSCMHTTHSLYRSGGSIRRHCPTPRPLLLSHETEVAAK